MPLDTIDYTTGCLFCQGVFETFFQKIFTAREHDYLPALIYGIPIHDGSTGTAPLDTYYYTRILENVKY